jgi:hypothetical protein
VASSVAEESQASGAAAKGHHRQRLAQVLLSPASGWQFGENENPLVGIVEGAERGRRRRFYSAGARRVQVGPKQSPSPDSL